MATVINALGQLPTSKDVSDAVKQTLPLLTGATAHAAINAIGVTSRVVQARQDANLGLSSGDDFITNRQAWLKPFGSWARQDDRDGVAGFDADTGGLIIGADGVVSDRSRLGVAFAYARTHLDGDNDNAPQSAEIDSYQAIVYGSYSFEQRTDLNYQIDYGRNQNNGTRTIDFGGLYRKASSDFRGDTLHAGVGVGRSFELTSAAILTPSVRVDYTTLKNHGYTESGAGALNLNIDSDRTEQLLLDADVKLNYKIADGWTALANLGAAYDTMNERSALTSSYVGGGAAFTTKGIDPSPWILHAGVGIAMNQGDAVEVTGRYDVEQRDSGFLEQTVSVKLRVPF